MPSPARLGRETSGFALLAILLLVAAMTLMVGMSLQVGLDSRRVAAQAHNEQLASGMAEAGLERTRTYLAAMLASETDLDRALDPQLDTDCTTLADGDSDRDDFIPRFDDTGPGSLSLTVEYPPGSGLYYKFIRRGEGGYLVRIDDNEDDALPAGAVTSTDRCTEGTAPTLVRDRDRSVIVTSIGFYPLVFPNPLPADVNTLRTLVQSRLTSAQARRVLRARVAPRVGAGVIVGGDFELSGNARVCGEYGNVMATGNLNSNGGGNAELCSGSCNPDTVCTASARGDCEFTGGVCEDNSSNVPDPPPVRVWSSINAPPRCDVDGTCIPFYYVRHHNGGSGDTVQVFMWNYLVCPNPRMAARIPTPNDPPPSPPPNPALPEKCWTLVIDTKDSKDALCTADDKAVYFIDSPLLHTTNPRTLNAYDPVTPANPPLFPDYSYTPARCPASSPPSYIFKLTSYGLPPDAAVAGCAAFGPYPDPAFPGNEHLQHNKLSKMDFKYENAGAFFPRGVWLIEGNFYFSQPTLDCLDPLMTAAIASGWGVSLMTTGDIFITEPIRFDPIHPRGFALLSGQDLQINQGNTSFDSCTRSAAVMVHEQMEIKGNGVFSGQLVVESPTDCSDTLWTTDLRGTSEIRVSRIPPIPTGSGANVASWSDSAL